MNIRYFFSFSFLTLFVSSFSASAADSDPVIMTIDGQPILKSEFEYVYNKNNANNTIDKKSLDEYAQLFVNYKLKVADAKEKNYEKRGAYSEEFAKYREQLALPYMLTPAQRYGLIKEAYQRSKVSVFCSHILISPNHQSSLSSSNLIKALQDSIQQGVSFASLAKHNSDCPSSRQGGSLGYVNVFDMVYPFENAMYLTPVGQVSNPVKTKFGTHFIKVSDRKPNIFKARCRQIFIPNGKRTDMQAYADSILALATAKNANFTKLVHRFSDGRMTADKDGLLPWIEKSSVIVPPTVIKAIFDMTKDGEVSMTLSPMGYHILKLEQTNIDLPMDSLRAELEQKILTSDRASFVGSGYRSQLPDMLNYSLVDSAALYQFVPLCQILGTDARDAYRAKLNSPLFRMSEVTYPQSEFFSYFEEQCQRWYEYRKGGGVREDGPAFSRYKNDSVFTVKTYNRFINNRLINGGFERLKATNPDFRNLLQEYSDGLLLFDVSDQMIWSKAVYDDKGLEEYFNAHSDKYSFDGPRFQGQVIYCKTEKVKREVDKMYEKMAGVSTFVMDSTLKARFNKKDKESKIIITEGCFSPKVNPAVDFYVFKQDTAYKSEKADYPFVAVYGEKLTKPTSYLQVRGAVVADYQDQLDQNWIADLRKKHTVEINQEVLHSIKEK